MYLVEIVLLSLIFPLITVLWFFRLRRIKLQGTEVLVLKDDKNKENIKITENLDVPANHKWYRIKISFNRKVSSVERYKDQFDSEKHYYKISILDKSGEKVFLEERSIAVFFGFCWYPWLGKNKKSLDSFCDAVLLEFMPPGPGIYMIDFQLKAKEEGSGIKDVVLRVKEGITPLTKEPYVHTCLDLRKKKVDEKTEKAIIEIKP